VHDVLKDIEVDLYKTYLEQDKDNSRSPGYDINLDPVVLPLLTSFGGLVAGRASGRKKNLATKHDLRRSLRVSLSVGFARCGPFFFLSLFSA